MTLDLWLFLHICVFIIFQSDAREWVQNKLQTVYSDTRRGDPVLAEVKMLVHLLQDCSTILTPAYSIAQYFNKISVDYFRVTSLCMESKVKSGYINMFPLSSYVKFFEG